MWGICTKKIGAISQLGVEKITFPLKVVDGHTDEHLLLKSTFATKKRIEIIVLVVSIILVFLMFRLDTSRWTVLQITSLIAIIKSGLLEEIIDVGTEQETVEETNED